MLISKAEAIPIFERKVAIGEFIHILPEWEGPLHVLITYENGETSISIMGMQQFKALQAHIKNMKGGSGGKDTSGTTGGGGGSPSA